MPHNKLISELNTNLEDILEKVQNEQLLTIFALDKIESLLEKALFYKQVFQQTNASDLSKKNLNVVINKISQSINDIQDKIEIERYRLKKGSDVCQI